MVTAYDRPALNIAFRVWVSLVIAFTLFFVLMLRLWYLQIAKGDYFRDKSENNRLRTIYIPSPRGFIFDRNGEPLVGNRPSFNVDFVIEDSPDVRTSLKQLSEMTAIDQQLLADRLKDQKKRKRYEPKLVIKDVSRDLVARISANRIGMPGVVINPVPAREYFFANLAAHVLGYIREISGDQLKNPHYAGYRPGDQVGQYGVESRWERYLRGVRGVQTVIVNALGTKMEEAFFESEIPGHNVHLTIDRKIQQVADESLNGKKGALVVMDVRTGEILALASAPGFDPNVFAGELTKDQWVDIVDGPDNKLTNRVVQGSYPPGSVFKIFVALAGLTEKVINPQERIHCPGFLMFGGRRFRCHKHSGHGSVNLYEALVQSCDVYFYTLGQRLGVDGIHDFAALFGFGESTDLGLAEESSGLIPSTEWKKRAFKKAEDQRWYPGETLSVAIGQGAITTTPLQIARALAALVNGGKLLKPKLVRAVIASDGRALEKSEIPEVTKEIRLDKNALAEVRKSLEGVVSDPRGTGRKAAMPESSKIGVAGKTGTAQVMSQDAGGNVPNDHAWFAAYAPADKPQIVVVSLVENGGHGGAVAAPLVAKVMKAYFGIEDKEDGKPAEGDAGD